MNKKFNKVELMNTQLDQCRIMNIDIKDSELMNIDLSKTTVVNLTLTEKQLKNAKIISESGERYSLQQLERNITALYDTALKLIESQRQHD